jgi:hypothetical protein
VHAKRTFENALRKRREIVFGTAVLASGLCVTILCLMPTLLADTVPESLLPTAWQERFFFDVFGIIGGLWLLCWVSAINQWHIAARTGQWTGILLLSAQQAILTGIFKVALAHMPESHAIWVAPAALQVYLVGLYFGFFTLPKLTDNGNLRLTGLGTLVLLLPWLFGKDAFVSGVQYLYGFTF